MEHKNAQLAVKYYNYLSGVFLHYEMLVHKGWYDFVEEIRKFLNLPILKKNQQTNWLESNFHSAIYELIRACDVMYKLGLCNNYRHIINDSYFI